MLGLRIWDSGFRIPNLEINGNSGGDLENRLNLRFYHLSSE